MVQDTAQREEYYCERGLSVGDMVKHRHKAGTKLHPKWDSKFIICDITDKNTYQLQTRNSTYSKASTMGHV